MESVSRLPGVQYVAISDSLPPDQGGEDDTFSIPLPCWQVTAGPCRRLPGTRAGAPGRLEASFQRPTAQNLC
jgi:hypothetical protein